MVKGLSVNADALPINPKFAVYYGQFSNAFTNSATFIFQAALNIEDIVQMGFYFSEQHYIYTRRKTKNGWSDWKNV